jgi:pilus assembly protein CpaC
VSKFILRAALLALSCLAVAPVAHVAAQPSVRGNRVNEAVELNLGEQIVLPAQGVKTYSEGVKGIADIRLTGDASRFVVVGVRPGTTTLLCIMIDNSEKLFTITVNDPNGASKGPPTTNPLAVTPQASIRLDLYFVQIDRNRSLNVGMGKTENIGGLSLNTAFDLFTSTYTTKTAAVMTNFVPELGLAQSQGWAKVARHVALITANGAEANFDSGGEFNVLRNTGLTQAIVSVKFGAQLSVLPRYDESSGRIELSIKSEISDLAPGSTDIPGRTLSAVQAVSNLALGESLAVAGLVSKNERRTRGGLPYLSQIPVIGWIFGKRVDSSTEVENVLIIAPSVVEPLKHPRGREFLANAVREFDEFNGMGDGHHLFPGTAWAHPAKPVTPAPKVPKN